MPKICAADCLRMTAAPDTAAQEPLTLTPAEEIFLRAVRKAAPEPYGLGTLTLHASNTAGRFAREFRENAQAHPRNSHEAEILSLCASRQETAEFILFDAYLEISRIENAAFRERQAREEVIV